jgi:hypothetical protein
MIGSNGMRPRGLRRLSSRRWTRSLVEDCVLTARADGGTDVTSTMYFDPAGTAGLLMRHSFRRIGSNIQSAMKALARRAATA